MDQGIIVLSDDDTVVGMNSVAESILDVDTTSVGAAASDVLANHPDLYHRLESRVRTNEDISLETQRSEREYKLSISPVSTARAQRNGNDTNRIVVIRESTRVQQVEQEVQQYRTLIEESSDAVTHIRPDGSMANVFGVEEVVGRTATEFVNEPLDTFIHPADREKTVSFFEDVLTGDPERLEARFKRGDGSWMWIQTTGAEISNSSIIDGAVTMTRDVTERKRKEQQRQPLWQWSLTNDAAALVELEIEDHTPVVELCQTLGCGSITVNSLVPRSDETIYYLAPSGDDSEIEQAVAQTAEIKVLSESDHGPPAVVISAETPGRVLVLQGFQLRSCRVTPARTSVTATAPQGDMVQPTLEQIRDDYVGVTVSIEWDRGGVTQLDVLDGTVTERLTERQQEVLEVAYRHGYFKRDRDVNLSELADIMDISRWTVSEHLRLAQQKVFSELLEE